MGLFDFLRGEKRSNNFLKANLGGFGSNNQTPVTKESSLSFSAVYACVRIISESIASLPVNVYREEDDQDKITDKAHPVYKLLAKRPNQWMTSYSFIEFLMSNLLLEGNSYFFIERDSLARPIALIPILSENVKVVRHEDKIFYDVKDYDLAIMQEDMLHFYNLSLDGITGQSVIQAQRTTISTSISSNDMAGSYLGNSSQVGGIIKHPGKLSAEAVARLRTSWNQNHSGSFTAGKTAILEEGMTFEQTKINANDYQLIETRRFQVEEIARIFKVPLSLIGHLEKAANYSSIEALSIDFVRFTLTPYIVNIEQELNRKLFRDNEQRDYYTKINVSGLLRGDSSARATYYREMSAIGVLSINEIRRMEDLNRIGDEGDMHYYPLNFAPIGKTDEDE